MSVLEYLFGNHFANNPVQQCIQYAGYENKSDQPIWRAIFAVNARGE